MENGSEGVSVYAEAKSEYTKQLCQYLVPSIQQYFLDLLEEAKQKELDSKKVLVMFQTLLEDISDWNVDKVQRETGTIITGSQCDYLEELMTAVFIAHTKVLSAIRLTTKQKKLQITIPKLDHFIHRILRECSRLLWSNTYLFSSTAPSIERQKNLRQIEHFLQEGVLQGIRGMLPVKSILREYLKDDGEDEEDEEDKEEDEENKEEPEAEEKKPEEKKAEEKKPEEKKPEEKKPEEKKPEEKKPVTETIIVDTPSSVIFTGSDTLEEKKETAEPRSEKKKEEVMDDLEDMFGEIQIMDAPPEAMDGFEDLEKKDNDNEMTMDFETLE